MDILFDQIVSFFTLSFSAILIENAMLSRGLGTDRLLLVTEDLHRISLFSMVLTAGTTISCGIAYFLDLALHNINYNYSLKPFVYILALGLVYMGIHYVAKDRLKDYKKIEHHITVGIFNCAVLGSMLLVSVKSLTFMEALGFGFGTGVGYTLSTVFVAEGLRKMKSRDMPTTFRGLPAMLIYIGILSMAIYALTGYQL